MPREDNLVRMLLNAPDRNEPLPTSNRKETIYGTTIPFLIITWIAVGLRFWVRFKIMREPGWDDLMVLLSASLNTAATIIVIVSVNYGLGHHFIYLGNYNMTMYLKMFYFENAIYITETALIKLSLLVQYLRIFKSGTMRWICISLIVIIGLWGLAYSIMAWMPCFPIRAFWSFLQYPNANCYGFGFENDKDFISLFESHTALNMTFDLTVFLTPMVLFTQPNLRKKNLFAMVGIFLLGAVVVLTSVWRLYTIVENRAATQPYIDFTWWPPVSIILSCLEIDLAILCASIPIFWPVVEKSLSAIFVTHEVQITEHRRLEDEYELDHATSRDRQNSFKSQSESERGDSRDHFAAMPSSEGLREHYKDEYVMAQVVPLEAEGLGPQTNVRSDAERKKWRL